jgi:hypothetical protein
MIGYRITVTGLDAAISRVALVEELWHKYINESLEWFGKTVSEAAKADHPYQDRTGQLTASIGYRVIPLTGTKAYATVFATMPYAEAVENGTPTSRPYPFIWPKFYQYIPELEQRLEDALFRAIEDAKSQTGGV